MNSKCILTQVHVPSYDPQGSLTEENKLKLVEYSLKHLRAFNPDAYIILSGHGKQPENSKLCDYVYWEEKCRPLNQHGYVANMPAQFYFVSRGLDHAAEKGFTDVVKTRGDCIIGLPDIFTYCKQITTSEHKQFLITQQSGPERMGDCFMFGPVKQMGEIWWRGNPVWVEHDGLQNTAINFKKVMGGHNWEELVHKTCAFRDVNKLKFTCLRWNFHKMMGLPDKLQKAMLDPSYNFEPYHWGKANNWHHFDAQGVMTGEASWLWSERTYYAQVTDSGC